MENTRVIEIKDFDNTLKFKIRLFGALEGLDFMDTALGLINSKERLTIRPFLETLLKLATPLDLSGNMALLPPGKVLTLSAADEMFQNPISLLTLGFQILDFQKVFLESSPQFRPLIRTLEEKFHIKILD